VKRPAFDVWTTFRASFAETARVSSTVTSPTAYRSPLVTAMETISSAGEVSYATVTTAFAHPFSW
jgi:hypothetical protein